MSRIQYVPPDTHDDSSDDDDSGDEGTTISAKADPSAPKPMGEGFAAPPPPKKKPSDNFQASTQFQGPKPGFIFKNGPLGLGYYKDLSSQQKPPTEVAAHVNKSLNAQPAPSNNKSAEPSALDTLRLLRAKEAEEHQNPRFTKVPDAEDPKSTTVVVEDEPKEKSSFFASKLKKRISKTKETMKESIKRRTGPGEHEDGAAAAPVAPATSTPTATAPAAPAPAAAPAANQSAPPASGMANFKPKVAETPPPAAHTGDDCPEARLEHVSEDLGFGLPECLMGLPESFATVVRCGNILHLSAHGPQLPREGFVRGKINPTDGMDRAQVVAVLTAMSILKSVREHVGSLNSVRRVLRLRAFIACESDDGSALLDVVEPLASVFTRVFGEQNRPAITVCGAAVLPFSIPMQVEADLELTS